MSDSPKIKVAVLMGGPSSEHEVSLSSGKAVIKRLNKRKYEVRPVLISKDGRWIIEKQGSAFAPKMTLALKEKQALRFLKKEGVEVVFVALHGEHGEDGTLQRALQQADLAFTGSGPEASILGMNKLKSLKLFAANGLEVPKFIVFGQEEWLKDTQSIIKKIEKEIGLPAVVKPVSRGSSIGVTIVKEQKFLAQAINESFKEDKDAMVQKYIRGREFACGVLEDKKDGAFPLLPTEIKPKEKEFFDYHSKYVAGATEEITPPNLPKKTIKLIQKTALLAHQAINASGMSRADMILGEDGKLYILEINTIPGLTKTSLLPQGAKALGIGFSKMLDMVIEAALNKFSCNV